MNDYKDELRAHLLSVALFSVSMGPRPVAEAHCVRCHKQTLYYTLTVERLPAAPPERCYHCDAQLRQVPERCSCGRLMRQAPPG